MMRLILLLLFASLLVFVIVSAVSMVQSLRGRRDAALPARQEDAMPAPFRTIAYLLLLALMAGSAVGWLGAS